MARSETDLYPPIKAFLEGQGYEVKSEIGTADIVALRPQAQPLIVELKLGFSLALFHQAIARLSVSDTVYIAVAHGPTKRFAKALKANVKLARRLGLGLITVRLSDELVTVHCDPGPYAPRKSKPHTDRLLKEFAKREGDPNIGGQASRAGLVTAYRQDALKLVAFLKKNGVCKGAQVAKATGVPRATAMMRDNHYGWFEKVCAGHYQLSQAGETYILGFSEDPRFEGLMSQKAAIQVRA
jgi:hypothetical protein